MVRSLVRRWSSIVAFAAVLVLAGATGVVRAQTCGDPDGSGSVTVTDGVNVLREAAVLPSSCDVDPRLCDVDGSGTVTVTDGVNVLRAAAQLGGALTCPGTAQTIAPVVGQVQAALEIGLGFIPGQPAQAAAVSQCDSGTVDIQETRTTFDQCRFGQLVFDGTIVQVTGGIEFAFRLALVDSTEFIDLGGTLSFDGETLNGTLVVASGSFDAFQITFENVTRLLSDLGTPVGGLIRIETGVGGALIGNVRAVEEIFNGDQPVTIRAILDDDTVQTFVYDPISGTIRSDDAPPPARIARAEITISGQAFRFALDDLRFGSTTITFDEPAFQAPSPVNGKSVGGVTFFFSEGGAPSTDATVGGSNGPGDTPLISPPILEGTAAGTLVLQFDPPVEALRFSFATNPVEGAITSAGLRVFDARGVLLGTASQTGSVPPGFTFPEGSLGAAAVGITSVATTSVRAAGSTGYSAASSW